MPQPRVSTEIERWLEEDGEQTLGGLIDFFGPKSFALVFILLLGVPAMPFPTGGASHVLIAIAVLVACQLVLGFEQIWLPSRWRHIDLAGPRRQRFIDWLRRLISRLECVSRPRLAQLYGHRLSNVVFGLLVIGGSVAAFLAPPFTGLDILPALGIVLLSLSVLLEDIAIAVAAMVIGAAGVALELFVGAVALHAITSWF